ncbi:hypothetical protein [Paraburkholderia graminis]|uniref:hypothetical protein n=1 Tax=Paraburkholderia graminis TaxID=60548 RepID=UPI0027D7D3B4|nr:hypothetical protein [Paraburkholderia graminis]
MDYVMNPMRTLHAGRHCGCGVQPVPEALGLSSTLEAAEIELAKISSSLLEPRNFPELNHKSVAAAIARGAVEKGLVQSQRFCWSATQKFFSGHPLLPLIRRTGISIERSLSFRDVLKGQQFLRHPVEAILMLRVLHDGWSQVTESLNKGTELPVVPSERANVPSNGNASAEYLSQYRKENFEVHFKRYAAQYVDLRKDFPDLTHTELMGLLPSHASKYLTEESLAAAGIDVPNVQKSGLRIQKLDEELAVFIRERARHLRDTAYPKRVSRWALMSGFRRPRVFSKKGLAPLLIRAREAMEECEEKQKRFKQRKEAMTSARKKPA